MRLIIATILVLCAQLSWGFYSPSDGVVELNSKNFDMLVTKDDAIWIVEFYAPWCGHCQKLIPEYQKLAKALKGVVKVGAVNADEERTLSSQYGVQGFPTIKIFGANKRSPVDFHEQRTAKAMAKAALAEAHKKVRIALGEEEGGDSGGSNDVIELTDSNFDRLVLESDDVWLVEFFAPWCGHCKNLAPHWAKAAKELKGKVKLGALDATVHQSKAEQYGIRGYPTIKFFPGGKKSAKDVEDYDGGRTASEIVNWALEKHSDNVPAPELIEILDDATFDKACEGKPLCVVSFLPHILDCEANCRNEFLDILKELGEKYKKKLWGWAWAVGLDQQDLEESLDIGGFGYPAMAVVNFKKMKYSVLKGSFSKNGINEFLRDISYGRGQTAPVRGAKKPQINKVEPWDGKDGEWPEVDDDYVPTDDDSDEEKPKDEL